jgi:hypothetical protein
MRPFALASAVITACGLLACGLSATGPRTVGDRSPLVASDSAALQTSEGRYELQDAGAAWRVRILATFTNRTGRTVFVHTAGGNQPTYHLDRLENGTWTLGFAPVELLIATPPRLIPPGSSQTDTITVLAAKPGRGEPRFTSATIAGTYRLVYDLYGTETADGVVSNLSDPLPLELRASNPFEIR